MTYNHKNDDMVMKTTHTLQTSYQQHNGTGDDEIMANEIQKFIPLKTKLDKKLSIDNSNLSELQEFT